MPKNRAIYGETLLVAVARYGAPITAQDRADYGQITLAAVGQHESESLCPPSVNPIFPLYVNLCPVLFVVYDV